MIVGFSFFSFYFFKPKYDHKNQGEEKDLTRFKELVRKKTNFGD